MGEIVTKGSEVTRYRYVYEGNKVIGLIKNNSEYYYYQYGANGNIERICNADGSIAAKYAYDAWGNCRIYTPSGLDVTENSEYNSHIGRINPFRYKGYYFDSDTGYYYLQSRYYDPQTRRFINAFILAIYFIVLAILHFVIFPDILTINEGDFSKYWQLIVIYILFILGYIAHFGWKLVIKQFFIHKYDIHVEIREYK